MAEDGTSDVKESNWKIIEHLQTEFPTGKYQARQWILRAEEIKKKKANRLNGTDSDFTEGTQFSCLLWLHFNYVQAFRKGKH